jgi:putative ABC transport system substrate-binding protein
VNRRKFIALTTAASAWPHAARAQQSERVRRIGVLMALARTDPEAQLRAKALEAGLRELGWVEGRNIRLEYRWAPGEASALRAEAAELIRSMPELIVAHSTPAVAALRQDGLALPIVFVQVTDPIDGGFVPNFTRPGGHMTGFTSFEFTIGSKWLEALKLVAPTVQRVALIFNPETAPFRKILATGGGRGALPGRRAGATANSRRRRHRAGNRRLRTRGKRRAHGAAGFQPDLSA